MATADVQRTIEILFNATDSTGSAIKSVSAKMDQLAGSVEGMTAPIAEAHDWVLRLEAALGLLAVGGLALSVSAAGEFGDQFKEISTIIDASDDDILTFKEDIKAYAQDSSQALDTINSSLYNAISAGIDYKDSIESLATAEKLSVAGKADLDSTLLSLVGTLNAYGESTEEADRYSDILFTTVERGITTIPELASGLSKVTSIAAGAGVPFETLSAALATVTSNGVPTKEAITGLKAVLSNIIKPTEQAAKIAESLGIQFNATALESKGLEGILLDVYNATDGNVEQMAQLFGSTEALNVVLSTIGQDGGAKFLENLEAMRNSTGATEAAYEKMADAFAITNQKLINNVKLTFISLGDNLLEDYGDIAGAVTEIFKSLQDSVKAGAFDDVFAVISDLSGRLTDELLAIADNLPAALENVDFDGFTIAIRDLAGEVGLLIENIFGADLSTAAGLEKAIQRVVDVITILTNVTTGIVEGWQDWAIWLEEIIDYLDDTDGATSKAIGNFLQMGKVINEIAGLVGGLTSALSGLGNLLNVLAAKQLVNLIGGLGGAKDKLLALNTSVTSLSGKAGLLGLAAAVGYTAGTMLRDWFPVIDKAAQKTLAFVDSIIGFTGATEAQEKAQATLAGAVQKYIDNIDLYPDKLDDLRDKLKDLGKTVDGLPKEVILQMAFDEGLVTPERLLQIAKTARDAAANEDPVKIPVGIDDALLQAEILDIAEATEEPLRQASKEMALEPEIKPKLETEDFKEAFSLLETQIKSAYETIQTQIEWEAKLEIADIEANAKKIEAIMESVSESATGASDVLSSIFGNIADLNKIADRLTIQDWIEDQIEIQRDALEIQRDVADAEIKLMEARIRRLESGDALLSIEAEGLQPALENVLWELLELIQTRVSEEGLDMLLGTI